MTDAARQIRFVGTLQAIVSAVLFAFLLTSIWNAMSQSEEAFQAAEGEQILTSFVTLTVFLPMLVVVCAVIGFVLFVMHVASWGLLMLKPWGRFLTVATCALFASVMVLVLLATLQEPIRSPWALVPGGLATYAIVIVGTLTRPGVGKAFKRAGTVSSPPHSVAEHDSSSELVMARSRARGRDERERDRLRRADAQHRLEHPR